VTTIPPPSCCTDTPHAAAVCAFSACTLAVSVLDVALLFADGPVRLLNGDLPGPSHATVRPAMAIAVTQRNSFLIRITFHCGPMAAHVALARTIT
jgi:hypothetical protein